MEHTNHPLTLDNMPDDMLRLIVSKVGAASSTDYANTVITCKGLNFGLDDPLMARTLNIAPVVDRPHLADQYEQLIEQLMAANNLDAQYVTGMREFFHFDNNFLGLHFLRLASSGGHREAKYLYGLLHMALGWIEYGKKILSELTDAEGISSIERIWVSQLNVRMKDQYVDALCNQRLVATQE
ncbi:hypothetical protein Bca4012_058476 [Brassica carinata]